VNGRSYVLRMFLFYFIFSQLTFSDVCKPIFSKFFHMTWLYSKKKRCYADFLKLPPNKDEGRKPQISPNLAFNRNILCAVTRNVEGKYKIENNSVHQWLLAYTFTKFGRGRLNSDGDRRVSLCGGWENFAIFDVIARYISVTVQDSPIIAANDY